ncbi:MAG: tail fiber domain-containing protein, partial [Salinivirgaceae bacterium]|nr:tail fiber domain-containing protein [Salinivirgaceae bacterium]
TQVIVDEGDGKVPRSGLRVTGRNTKGDGEQNYLVVDPSGTQVIVDDELEGDSKVPRSGFVVTGRNTKGGDSDNYLKVATDGTKISFEDNSAKNKRSGLIVTGRSAKGTDSDIFEVTPDSTRVYVTGGSAKSGFGVEGKAGTGSGKNGFAVTEKSSSGNAGYLNVTAENFFAGYDAGRITKPSSVQNPDNWEYLPAGINNTYVGNNAGYNNNNGVNNVFMGYNAGYSTISNSVYKGTVFNSTTQQYEETYRSEGSFNVFIGSEAGQGNTSGMSNVFVGEKAGYNNSSCISNIFIGQDAGYYTTAGGKNLSWSLPGPIALPKTYNGSLNMFVGTRSGFRNTTGSKNTFIGHMAGYSNLTGESNVYIGYNAGSETTGSNNTIINSASGNYTGSNNIIIAGGTVSNDLLNGTEPNTNTVYSITDNAVAIGKLLLGKQGSTSSSGDGQLVVNGTLRSSHIYPIKNSEYPSYDIGSSAARWNKLYVKDIDMTGTWEAISAKKINASTVAAAQTTTVAVQGSISKSANASYTSGTTYGYGVQGEANVNGTTDYKYTHNRGVYGYAYGWYADKNIGVYGYSQSPSTAKQANANYGVYASATRGTTAYGIYAEATLGTTNWAGYFKGNVKVEGTVTESSDARLKKDVQTISGALDKVLKLRGISYYWKNMEEMAAAKGVPADSSDYCYDSRKHIGVIAQEIETEFPELVSTDDKGFKSVEYTAIAPILIEAVKELKAEKDALEAKLDKQQAENEAMKARMEKMEKMLEELLKKQ